MIPRAFPTGRFVAFAATIGVVVSFSGAAQRSAQVEIREGQNAALSIVREDKFQGGDRDRRAGVAPKSKRWNWSGRSIPSRATRPR